MWVLWIGEALASSAIDTEHAVAPDLEVSIEMICGSLSVRGADRKTVRITGSVDDPESLDVSALPGQVSIEVEGGRMGRNCANLVVDVPRHASLTVETVSAPLSVVEVAGRLNLETTSGPITVTGTPTAASCSSISGPVTVSGAVTGGVEVETVSGPIRVEGATGRIEAESVSGRIDLAAGGLVHTLDVETMSGAITVSAKLPPRGTWSAESHTGRLDLVIPADASAVVGWSTFSGTVSVCEGDSRKEGTATLGAGDARIDLETFTGAIRVVRSTTP